MIQHLFTEMLGGQKWLKYEVSFRVGTVPDCPLCQGELMYTEGFKHNKRTAVLHRKYRCVNDHVVYGSLRNDLKGVLRAYRPGMGQHAAGAATATVIPGSAGR